MSHMLVLGLILIGLTLVLTLAICRIHERKKQFVSIMALLGVVILLISIPEILRGGLPDVYYVVLLCALLLVLPLAIIVPGTLGFWPETGTTILRNTFLCSVFTLGVIVLMYTAIVQIVPIPVFVTSASQVLTVLFNIPGGIQLALLILFLLFTLLSVIGYRVIGMIPGHGNP